MSNGNIEIAPIDGFEDTIFANGINFFNGRRVAGKCVTGHKLAEDPEANDDDRIEKLVVQDSTTFESTLNSATTVSLSGYGQSASGAFSYLREQTGSDTSISFVGLRVIKAHTRIIDWTNAKISQAALDLLRSKGPIAFAQKYGTHCVIGVCYGGSFAGRLRLETATSTDKTAIAASLKSSFDMFGVSGKVESDFNSKISNSGQHIKTTLQSVATGAPRKNYEGTDLDKMMTAMNTFELKKDTKRKVDGNATSFLAMTWDNFSEIQDVLDEIGQSSAMQFAAEQEWGRLLMKEHVALSYLIGTCDDLLNRKSYAIPQYEDVLVRMKKAAEKARLKIESVTISMLSEMDDAKIQAFVITPRLKPLIDAIARGQVLVKTTYWFDGAFESQYGIIYMPATIGPGLWKAKSVSHGESRNNKFAQNMTCYFQVWRDAGDLVIQSQLTFHDPYAPKDRIYLDYPGMPTRCSGPEFPVGSSTAVWGEYPDGNSMKAEFAGADLMGVA